MLSLIGEDALIKSLSEECYMRYGHQTSLKRAKQKKIVSASQLFDSDDDIIRGQIVKENFKREIAEDLLVEVLQDIERLTRTINNILGQPKNWIISGVHKENYKMTTIFGSGLLIFTFNRYLHVLGTAITHVANTTHIYSSNKYP
jgi:ATP-dependent DNA helicase DinG